MTPTKFVVGLPVKTWPYDVPGCEQQPCLQCQQPTWAYPEYTKNGNPLFCKDCVLATIAKETGAIK